MNVELFAVFFIPWLLDLLGGRAIMATLFGALLWGTAVILVSAKSQVKDLRISRTLQSLIWALSGAWISYWLFALSNEPQHTQWLGRPLQWLAWTHAGLLTAGAACMLLSAIFASLWLLAEARVRKGSWQRRNQGTKLPSLEASSRISLRSFVLGVLSWTCGLLLASMNGFVQWSTGIGNFAEETHSRWAWASDAKFVVAAMLWSILVTGLSGIIKIPKSSRLRFATVLTIGLVFLAGFYCLLTLDQNTRHIPVRWFVK